MNQSYKENSVQHAMIYRLVIPLLLVVAVSDFATAFSVNQAPNNHRRSCSIKTLPHCYSPPSTSTTLLSSSSGDDEGPGQQLQVAASSLTTKIAELLSEISLDGLLSNLDVIQANTFEGEWGTRGEVYTAAQFALLGCIVFGGIPLVGPLLTVLFGPVLLVAGLITIVLGVNGLGQALSPWPTVPKTTQADSTFLKTDGLFQYMRHPIYAGLLGTMMGLSVVTGSATRLLLTAILWYILDMKSSFEETSLLETFGSDYESYQEQVPDKFFPTSVIMKELPF